MIPHLKYNDENCRLVVMAWRMFSMRQEQGKMKRPVSSDEQEKENGTSASWKNDKTQHQR
jgi:hypothetical protein